MTLTDHLQPLLDKRFPAALVAILVSIAPALAGDHLEPEDSIYSGVAPFQPGYDRAMVASFADAFKADVEASAIVQPSFEPEFAVGVKQDADGYRIFYQEASQQLWQYSVLEMMKRGEITSADANGKSTTAEDIAKLEKSLPPNPKDVKINRCEYAIDSDLGAKIVDDWRRMLLGTRYAKRPRMGIDGTFYHFFAKSGYQGMAGKTWSPDPATATGMLAQLADSMKTLCTTKRDLTLREVEKLTGALASKLGADPGNAHDD